MDLSPQTSTLDDRTSPRLRRRGERAAGLVEYALLVALLSLVCLSAINLLSGNNGGNISKASDSYYDATH